MTRRIMILIPILALLAAQLAFGAEKPLPPRQKTQKNPPPAAETEKTPPITVLSIIPAQGEPGTTVTLYGAGFTEKTTVFLGNVELPARVIGAKQLTFDIPKLPPGLYALFLKREDGTTSKPYNFPLLPPKPAATSLSPDSVSACATGRDRDVTLSGRNFQEGSQVLFDGAAIRSRFISPETLSFSAPQVAGGLHQVLVKNPEETLSGALALFIDTRPEITGVTRGEEYVNYYNLIIEGRNFQQNSAVVVMEEQTIDQTGSQLPAIVKRITSSGGSTTERERVLFINCGRIIYQRYPYSTTLKNFKVQVVNPAESGESSVVSVTAP